MKEWRLTGFLFCALLLLSAVSLFVGVIDLAPEQLFSNPKRLEIFIVSRLPRLLAILCTGVGMSVAGLIMQQLCIMKEWRLTGFLFCALLLLSAVSLFVGVIDLAPEQLFSNPKRLEIFIVSRLPRLLAILCTGVGMSVAGLIMQQLCMNKFVSPTTGATISSAQLGILFALLFLPDSTLWERAAFAFAAAILGTWVFVWFIQRMQFKDVVMVPLVGIMFGNVISGVTSYLAYKYEMTQALSSWLVGHFSMVLKGRYEIVYLVVPLVILAFLFANHFNIVGMGKDFSKNLGVSYNTVLFMGLTIAAMITASVVVVVGSISYIGLIVPNIVAMFKGDKIRGTLVDTALFGAIFVLVCDMTGRIVIAPYELPIELIVGILGSVLFVGLLLYRLRYGRKAVSLPWNEKRKRLAEGGAEG